jgi:predicted transcriptional regulator
VSVPTNLTPLELVIMKSLWRRRSAVVREVQADLLPERKLAYTTVMTVMDRLFKKGALRRSKKSRAHLYEPVFTEGDARADALNRLIDSYFDGSKVRLSQHMEPKTNIPVEKIQRRRVPGTNPIDDSLL